MDGYILSLFGLAPRGSTNTNDLYWAFEEVNYVPFHPSLLLLRNPESTWSLGLLGALLDMYCPGCWHLRALLDVGALQIPCESRLPVNWVLGAPIWTLALSGCCGTQATTSNHPLRTLLQGIHFSPALPSELATGNLLSTKLPAS